MVGGVTRLGWARYRGREKAQILTPNVTVTTMRAAIIYLVLLDIFSTCILYHPHFSHKQVAFGSWMQYLKPFAEARTAKGYSRVAEIGVLALADASRVPPISKGYRVSRLVPSVLEYYCCAIIGHKI